MYLEKTDKFYHIMYRVHVHLTTNSLQTDNFSGDHDPATIRSQPMVMVHNLDKHNTHNISELSITFCFTKLCLSTQT